jgi:hypothetical protein
MKVYLSTQAVRDLRHGGRSLKFWGLRTEISTTAQKTPTVMVGVSGFSIVNDQKGLVAAS